MSVIHLFIYPTGLFYSLYHDYWPLIADILLNDINQATSGKVFHKENKSKGLLYKGTISIIYCYVLRLKKKRFDFPDPCDNASGTSITFTCSVQPNWAHIMNILCCAFRLNKIC